MDRMVSSSHMHGLWRRGVATAALVLAVALPTSDSVRAQSGGGAEKDIRELGPGAVLALEGTQHLWIVDADGVLHWGGDTRALAGRSIDWAHTVRVSADTLQGARVGEPWLSSGLVRI